MNMEFGGSFDRHPDKFINKCWRKFESRMEISDDKIDGSYILDGFFLPAWPIGYVGARLRTHTMGLPLPKTVEVTTCIQENRMNSYRKCSKTFLNIIGA